MAIGGIFHLLKPSSAVILLLSFSASVSSRDLSVPMMAGSLRWFLVVSGRVGYNGVRFL